MKGNEYDFTKDENFLSLIELSGLSFNKLLQNIKFLCEKVFEEKRSMRFTRSKNGSYTYIGGNNLHVTFNGKEGNFEESELALFELIVRDYAKHNYPESYWFRNTITEKGIVIELNIRLYVYGSNTKKYIRRA